MVGCGLVLVNNGCQWIKVGESGFILQKTRSEWVRVGQSGWEWVGVGGSW